MISANQFKPFSNPPQTCLALHWLIKNALVRPRSLPSFAIFLRLRFCRSQRRIAAMESVESKQTDGKARRKTAARRVVVAGGAPRRTVPHACDPTPPLSLLCVLCRGAPRYCSPVRDEGVLVGAQVCVAARRRAVPAHCVPGAHPWCAWTRSAGTLESMMLDTDAETIDKDERPEVLSLLPELAGKDVVELGAGMGRFTGALASRARSVAAVDFMDSLIKKVHRAAFHCGAVQLASRVTQNEELHGKLHKNVTFHCADATTFEARASAWRDAASSRAAVLHAADTRHRDTAADAAQRGHGVLQLAPHVPDRQRGAHRGTVLAPLPETGRPRVLP